MSKKKGLRSFKNKLYYERQVSVTERNKAKKAARAAAFIADALTRTSGNAVAKRALRERKASGTAYFGPEVEVTPEPKLKAAPHARAELSVTFTTFTALAGGKSSKFTMYRLPIDTTDPKHVAQGVALLSL